MTTAAEISKDGRTLTIRFPLTVRKRGGRKLVVAPEGDEAWLPSRARVDNTVVKALARAHRWKRLLESGKHSCVSDLAAAERINKSYLCRVLRMSLLAPNIVEAILDGRQPPAVQLDRLLKPFPVEWDSQRRHFAAIDATNHRNPWVPPTERMRRKAKVAIGCPAQVHQTRT